MILKLAATRPRAGAPAAYPYKTGRLSFPKDEGRHTLLDLPITLVEWHALYAHLAAEDGSRYLLFTTFVSFDPVEPLLRGKFPHCIATLVDVTGNATHHHYSMDNLKRFADGHADDETAEGDRFRWKGPGNPFEYDFHVAWKEADFDCAADLDLKMVKPPLVLNGTGYVQLPSVNSGYYSQTRVRADGRLVVNGVGRKVSGVLWVDRQWLGLPTADGSSYCYDWWGLQLDNDQEAIMFRIWDTRTRKVAASRLEINRADGTREPVEEFTLEDTPRGWRVQAPEPGWDLTIARVCQGHPDGGKPTKTFVDARWYSCDVQGTVAGKTVGGVAVAELVPGNPPAVSAADVLKALGGQPKAR